jgi:hypothetical protein
MPGPWEEAARTRDRPHAEAARAGNGPRAMVGEREGVRLGQGRRREGAGEEDGEGFTAGEDDAAGGSEG